MYCDKYKCTMSKASCIARQKKSPASAKWGALDPGCVNCAQGKAVAAEIEAKAGLENADPEALEDGRLTVRCDKSRAAQVVAEVDQQMAKRDPDGRPDYSARLMAVRLAWGMSRKGLSRKARVAASTITNCEDRAARPYVATRKALAKALAVDEAWLFKAGEKDPAPRMLGKAAGQAETADAGQPTVDNSAPSGLAAAVYKDGMDLTGVSVADGISLITWPAVAPGESFFDGERIFISISQNCEPEIYRAAIEAARENRRRPIEQVLHWLDAMTRSHRLGERVRVDR